MSCYVRYSQAQDLAMTYNQNLSDDFPQQLLAFRNIMMSKIESNATIKDLAETAHCKTFIYHDKCSRKMLSQFLRYFTLYQSL